MTIKVAHLTTVDMSVRHLLLNQLLALRAAGFETFAMSAPGPDLGPVRQAGVTHFPVSFTRTVSPLADLRALLQLWRTFRRERFTIVHTHQAKAALFGQVVARAAGVPIVVNTLHGFYFHDRTPRLKRAIWVALERFQARLSDRILSQNPEDIETAVAAGICGREQIEWLGNGIDLERFGRGALPVDTRTRLRRELGIGERDLVVGFVGRMVREKGILDLFAAFEQVLRVVPAARLLVIGPEDRVKTDVVSASTARQYGIADRAVFVGYRHDMPELYAAMDVCVLPSHREGYPRSPMEASAMGVPCVATDIRGCRQVVRPGRNGLLVPVGDSGALASAIVRILTDEPLAAAMRAEGPAMARELFDERKVFGRVSDAYMRLLAEKRPVRRQPFKRAFDLCIAIPSAIVLLPIFVAIAVAVFIANGRPVFFRQRRPGYRGRPFELLKFRTMTAASDEAGRPLPDAQRLTRFGRFLRRTSLDEMPELLNVLRGDMSLVGPRPLLMAYMDRYTPRQARRHEVRPGITGLAQISGRNQVSWEERFELDVWYVDHWSLALDAKILLKTIWKVLIAEGISQAGRDTMDEFMGSPDRSHFERRPL